MQKCPLAILLLLSLIIIKNESFGQKCGTDEYYKQELQNNPKIKSQSIINETEYQRYLNLNGFQTQKGKSSQRSSVLERTFENAWGLCDVNNRVLKIPVVIHIIHTGTAVGVGANRSVAWVNTLLSNLNTKYRNTANSDSTIDTKIEFYLAKRDTNGVATTGINRVNGTTAYASYAAVGFPNNGASRTALLELSRWSNDKYLNIWVVNRFESGIGGYGTYPGDDTYNGTVISDNSYELLVHELGHVFNLAHTFDGDNDNTVCPADVDCSTQGDMICDTPPHKVYDCLSSDCAVGNSTGKFNAIKYNFMAYYYNTGGNCAIDVPSDRFTTGQRARLRAAALGKFRGKLLVSEALIPVNNVVEAGIRKIKTSCLTAFSPDVTLKNYGTSPITTATLTCKIDGILVQTYDYVGSIAANTSSIITMNNLNVSEATHSIEIAWSSINGVITDTFQEDNVYCGTFFTEKYTSETFELSSTLPSYLTVVGRVPANVLTNNGCAARGSKIMQINSFDTFLNTSDTDASKTTTIELEKSLDLTTATQANLTFNIAVRKSYYTDYWKSLKVQVSTDCGISWTTLYHKNDKVSGGTEPITPLPLWTVASPSAAPTVSYTPLNCAAWRKDTINLAAYLNQNIKVRFVHYGYKGKTDNIYLDDITLNKVSNFCVQSPNTNVADAYNTTTNPYPLGFTMQTQIQANWLQNVPNALLVLESKSKGFVITRLTTAQRNSLTPVQGMLIYNLDPNINCFQLYNGIAWKCIERSCNQ